MLRAALLLLILPILAPAPAQAREECPFLRDPVYWSRVAAPAPSYDELAVATLNVFRLFDDEQDGTERTRLKAEEFDARIDRIARYIVNDLGSPAVIGLQEVEDDTAVIALSDALARETGREYSWLLGDKTPDGDIRSALLFDTRVKILRHESLFAAKPYEKGPRFDRLPLVVEMDAGAAWPNAGRLTVAVVHLKSQVGLESDDDAERVLDKRRFQAKTLAGWTREQVRAGARLVVLGDFNAPVTDTDATRSEPMRILLGEGGLVAVAENFLRPTQRWTYRHHCSLQELDHLLVSPALVSAVRGYAIARGDTCLRIREKCTPERSVSDHDGVVLRLR